MVASGLVGVTVATAPPAEALECPDGWTTSGTNCELALTTTGEFEIPPMVEPNQATVYVIGGGGGGGGGTSFVDDPRYGGAGDRGNRTNFFSDGGTIDITGIGGGGTKGANPTYSGNINVCNSLGYNGTGGNPGGTTTVEADGVTYDATGGDGGSAQGTSGDATPGTGWSYAGTVLGKGGDGGRGCTNYNSGAGVDDIDPTGGEPGGVVVIIPMSTVGKASTPTLEVIDAVPLLRIEFDEMTAFPAVTNYQATCTDEDGTELIGQRDQSPIDITSGVTRGKTYTCTVKAYNGNWGPESDPSNSEIVTGAPQNTTPPSFTGTPAFKDPAEVLTGNAGVWNDFGIPGASYSYLWQSQQGDDAGNCSGAWSDAAGATKKTLNYTIVEDDVGKCLRLSVTGSNTNNPSWGSNTASSTASLQVTTQPAFTAQSPPEIADEGYFAGYTFAATGYRVAYSIDDSGTLTGLPVGMSIDGSTGALTGTPNVGTAGDYTYKVKATNDSGEAITETLTLTVSSGTVTTVDITTPPQGDVPSGDELSTQPVAQLLDENDRLIAGPTAVTASVSPDTGDNAGTLGGTTTVDSASGVVTFANLTLEGKVNTDYTITLTAGGVSADADPVQVTPGAVASLQIDTQPVAAAAAGDVLATQPVLTILDAQGNTVDDRSVTVTVSSVLASDETTAGGTVSGSQASGLATSTGIVTFTNLAFGGTVGTAYKLKFSVASPAVSALSQSTSNTAAGAAAKLSVQTQPALTPSEVVGDAFETQPVVQILDAGDNVTSSTATVTATPSGGTLGGTTGVAGVSGTATFTDLTFAGLVDTNYTLTFSSPGLTSVTSDPFNFADGQQGSYSTLTTSITATASELPADGTTTTTVTVQAKDAGGNDLTGLQGPVELVATSGTVTAATFDAGTNTYTATYTAT